MRYKFSDLVDVAKLDALMQNLYRATGIPSAITDAEGNVLVVAGWQEICVRFHRLDVHTGELCRQSDAYVKQHLADARPYLCYICANGLIDAAAPVIIDGVYWASIFTGQFLFGKPDLSYFERQAERYGFDKEAYLAALAKVPVYTPERVDAIMRYFANLAEGLAEAGLARLRQIERQARELRRCDEQIYKIFNSALNVAIRGYDEHGNITFWNNASEQVYGFNKAEVTGKPLNETIFNDKEAERLLAILKEIGATDSPYGPAEWKARHKSGTEKYVCSTLFPIRLSDGKREFICMAVDITEQKQLAKEPERLDRLNLIGEMAANLGHEIRNPMTTVRGYLQFFRNRHCYPEHADKFDLMIEELDRANQIIAEYLFLAGNKATDKKPSDLNHIIDALMPLLCAEAAKENKIIHLNQGDIETLLLDKDEIRLLAINIVKNVLEAVDQGGIISISTFTDDDGAVVLKVQDTGKGIPEELLGKIGTPFITTKTDGTGLGLAVCYSIAARHNAKISIQSDSAGTSVFVKFLGAKSVEESDRRGG